MIPNIRAWHKRQKRMIMMYDIVSIDFDRQEITEQEVFFDNEGIPDDRELIDYDFIELEIMQSTGVFDREGVEVYEGDIIRTQSPITDENRPEPTGVVEYWKGRATFSMVINENKDGYPLHQLIKNGISIVVVGNKYENPELLKEDE